MVAAKDAPERGAVSDVVLEKPFGRCKPTPLLPLSPLSLNVLWKWRTGNEKVLVRDRVRDHRPLLRVPPPSSWVSVMETGTLFVLESFNICFRRLFPRCRCLWILWMLLPLLLVLVVLVRTLGRERPSLLLPREVPGSEKERTRVVALFLM